MQRLCGDRNQCGFESRVRGPENTTCLLENNVCGLENGDPGIENDACALEDNAS